ncbi:hypothetical protein QCA50_013698 [Cerrena zonata]|uniref:Uncharacterized protein n=1 Tax=Cerrena zonata TaxID=2478898 RepID=A0AAW0G081_9APHY
MPTLWSTVLIDDKSIGAKEERLRHLELLSLLLDRSKNTPLAIHINYYNDSADVFRLLLPHITRARVLYFDLHSKFENDSNDSRSGSGESGKSGDGNPQSGSWHFPFLRSLSILPYPDDKPRLVSGSLTFTDAPLLERL